MQFLSWILFGVINGLILSSLDSKAKRDGKVSAVILGISGALSGGIVAFFLFEGPSRGFSITLLLIVMLEAMLLFILQFNKALRT